MHKRTPKILEEETIEEKKAHEDLVWTMATECCVSVVVVGYRNREVKWGRMECPGRGNDLLDVSTESESNTLPYFVAGPPCFTVLSLSLLS